MTSNIQGVLSCLERRLRMKPFFRSISPVQNSFTSFLTGGEGYHNFHHTFPWDYRNSECGQAFSHSTDFIDWTNRMGWSYDLKSVTKEHILQRRQRTGDLSDDNRDL